MNAPHIGDRVRLADTTHPKVAGRTGTVTNILDQPGVAPFVTVKIDHGGYTFADADQLEVLP